MKHGAGCLSSDLPGPGLLIDSYLILKKGSLSLGDVEVGCDGLWLPGVTRETEQLGVSCVSLMLLLLLGLRFPSRSLSVQGHFQEQSTRNCTLSQSQ